jgi:hypothetical protein
MEVETNKLMVPVTMTMPYNRSDTDVCTAMRMSSKEEAVVVSTV